MRRFTRLAGKTDWLLLVLALLSAFMIWGPGGSIAIIAAISIIGLPIAVVLWGLPFTALVLLPWRGLYLLSRRVLSPLPAGVLSLALTAGGLYAIDSQFPRGPHPDLPAFLAGVAPVQPIAPLPEGRIGLSSTLPGSDYPHQCTGLCYQFLSLPQVAELVVNPGTPAARAFLRRDRKAPCPDGWADFDDFTCQLPFSGSVPVVLTLTQFDAGTPPADLPADLPPDQAARLTALFADPDLPLQRLTRVTLSDSRDGALSVAFAARAATAVAGLFGMGQSGIMGERLTYGPRVEGRDYASLPDLPEDRPLPPGLLSSRISAETAPLHLLLRALGAIADNP